jgi:anti-sigma factor RsiW
MNKIHNVIVATDPTTLHLTVDGQAYHLRREEYSTRLANATAAQRAHFEILPSGYGIH